MKKLLSIITICLTATILSGCDTAFAILDSTLSIANAAMANQSAGYMPAGSVYNSASAPTYSSASANSYSNSSSSSSNSSSSKGTRKCGLCGGKGSYVKNSGGMGLKKFCSTCNKSVSDGHYHATCSQCHGSGVY